MSRFAPLFLIVAMMLWASSFVALKVAFGGFDPMQVVWGRMLVAVLCFALLFRRVWRFEYRAGDWKLLLIMTICEPCLYFIFEARALELTTAAQAGMITSMLPLMVAFSAAWLLHERQTRRAVTGFALAVAGAIWLSFASESSEQAPNPLLGNALEFMAMVCATGYSLALKKLAARYTAMFLTALQSAAGFLFFLPLMLRAETAPSWEFWPTVSVIYLGAAVTLGAYLLYNYAIRQMPVSRASAYTNLIPVFTLMLAWSVLGERLDAQQLLACSLVLGGVLLSQWGTGDSSADSVSASESVSMRTEQKETAELVTEQSS